MTVLMTDDDGDHIYRRCVGNIISYSNAKTNR